MNAVQVPPSHPNPQRTIPEFNVLLVGDVGVGKETFVKRLWAAETTYIGNIDVEIHSLTFKTSRGPAKFNVWYKSGEAKFRGLPDQCKVQGHCAIIMYDVTDRLSCGRVCDYQRDLKRFCKEIPIVLAGNKADEISDKEISFLHAPRNKGMTRSLYVSSKANYSVHELFLWLAQKLSGDNSLCFIETPALPPPEVTISEDDKMQLAAEIYSVNIATNTAAAPPVHLAASIASDPALLDHMPVQKETKEAMPELSKELSRHWFPERQARGKIAANVHQAAAVPVPPAATVSDAALNDLLPTFDYEPYDIASVSMSSVATSPVVTPSDLLQVQKEIKEELHELVVLQRQLLANIQAFNVAPNNAAAVPGPSPSTASGPTMLDLLQGIKKEVQELAKLLR